MTVNTARLAGHRAQAERRGLPRRPARCDDRGAGDVLRRGHLRCARSEVATDFQFDKRLRQKYAASDYGYIAVNLNRRVDDRDIGIALVCLERRHAQPKTSP